MNVLIFAAFLILIIMKRHTCMIKMVGMMVRKVVVLNTIPSP